MKKTFLLILILMGLRQMVPAQGIFQFPAPIQFPGTLQLNLNFSALPGSPGTNQPSGTANYYYEYNLGFSFSILISLGTNQATDGWLLQENTDGSYAPIMEFTNLFYYYSYSPWFYPSNSFFPVFIPVATNYDYTETLVLTTNQIQALVAGRWYAEVSYGNDEYLGQLSPKYIGGPFPAITISPSSSFQSAPVIGWPSGNVAGAVISPASDKPALVTLDGSNSSDPYYLPLQFLWWDGNDLVASTAATTLKLMPGNYAFSLEVEDGYSTNSAMAMVDVLSPEEAIDELSSAIAGAGLDQQTTHRLTSTLQRAQSSLERGDVFLGARDLAIFQNDVNLFFSQMNSWTAFFLYNGAGDIINAVGGEAVRSGTSP